jgi:dipeptidyl aminopeptidase/acylaminoacyl peptidase
MKGYSDKDSKTSDLTLFNLNTGTAKNIGNVKEFSVNKKGDLLAYIISADGMKGNGVELFYLDSYRSMILDSDTTAYAKLTWEKEGTGLAFLKEFSDTSFIESNHMLFSVRDIYGSLKIEKFNPAESSSIPEGMRVRETYTPRFSKDLSILYFGVFDWTPSPEKGKKKDKEKLPGVDIWHWKDEPIQPRQEIEYNRGEKDFTYLFSWNLSNGTINRITDDIYKDGTITGDGMHVIIRSDDPYSPAFRLSHYDYYIVDSKTGTRRELLKNFTNIYGSSPDGKYILYFKDKNWFAYNVNSSIHTNLTKTIENPLWDIRDDGPEDIKPPFGYGGWYKDDSHLLIYDEYDIWKISMVGGTPQKITDGRENRTIYRVTRLNRDDNFFKPDEPLYTSSRGDITKMSGYSRITTKGKLEELIYEEMAISGLTMAKDNQVFAFRKEKYDDSPDIFITTDKFSKQNQISETNPQQENYYWGKSELVNYTNSDGKELQGSLFYPANYDPSKKYPMIVYIYEILSTGVHRYTSPSLTSAYNTTNYTSNGYFVFQPDIIYKINHPGESAVDCVVPAVEQVIKSGMIDTKAIGLMGHSWGAYQTSFIITQTDLFSAAVAGAPLINMISMYNEIYWNSGSPNQGIFETSQGRLREPWWDIMDDYIANSPMFNADKIVTPLLVTFGNKDGAVDWHQGIEMYATMRRMEKPFILLVYDGENHGLRIKENMKDYSEKVFDFFDFYLKGGESKEWIMEGKSYMEKKREEDLNKK